MQSRTSLRSLRRIFELSPCIQLSAWNVNSDQTTFVFPCLASHQSQFSANFLSMRVQQTQWNLEFKLTSWWNSREERKDLAQKETTKATKRCWHFHFFDPHSIAVMSNEWTSVQSESSRNWLIRFGCWFALCDSDGKFSGVESFTDITDHSCARWKFLNRRRKNFHF